MNKVKGISIRGKLLTGFALVLGIVILMFGFLFININHNRVYSEKVVTIYIPAEHNTVDLITVVNEIGNDYAKWLATGNEKYKSNIDAGMNRALAIVGKIDAVKHNVFDQSESVTWQNIKSSVAQLYALKEKVAEMMAQPGSLDDKSTSKYWVVKVLPLVEKINQGLNNGDEGGQLGFADAQAKLLMNGINSMIDRNDAMEFYIIIIVILTAIFSIAVIYITANKISLPLNEAIDAAEKIALGDRQVQLSSHSNDETGLLIASLAQMQQSIRDGEESLRVKEKETRELLDEIVSSVKRYSEHSSRVANGDLRERIELNGEDNEVMVQLGVQLNSMTDNLCLMTRQIMETSHNMVATLEQVRRAIDVQSSGATEQAASINEITASLGEIEKSTAQTIDKARALGKAAKKTQEEGQIGLKSVEESVNGMKLVRDKVQIIAQTILELSKQTQQVGEITAVVNNLAQQSKMLALNASIEAAKAGESGKGFAVVAAEVKNLAEQSEQSTTQVQKILEDIRHSTEKAVMVTEEGTKGVDNGMHLVEQAGEIIRNLNEVIHDATIASQQIEAAITQEGIGIEQITAGMNEINQVTVSLVQSVRQTTEAITNLSDISKKLKTSVDIYKV